MNLTSHVEHPEVEAGASGIQSAVMATGSKSFYDAPMKPCNACNVNQVKFGSVKFCQCYRKLKVDERRELLRRKNICFHCFKVKGQNHEINCQMKNKNVCNAHPNDSPSRFHHFSLCHAKEKQLVDQRKSNNAVMVSQVDGDNDEQEQMVMLASNDEGLEQGVDVSEELYVADISSYSLGASDSKDINKEDKTEEN